MDRSDQESVSPSGESKTLVFHIGDHKTGSTSIQHAFAAGRIQLQGKSLLYPTRLAHNSLADVFRACDAKAGQPQRARATEQLTRLAQTIETDTSDYVVISGESFEDVDPALFQRVVAEFFEGVVDQVRVVAYVRPHAARMLSGFVEQCKIGWFDGSLEAFVDIAHRHKRYCYLNRFQDWRKQFGNDFTLRPMIRSELTNGSVVDDFVNLALDTPAYEIANHGDANESLGLRDLVAVRFVQSRFSDQDRWLRHDLGWELTRLLGHQEGDSQELTERVRLPTHLAEQVREAHMGDARAMDTTFFDGRPLLQEELDRSVDNAPPKAQSLDVGEYLSGNAQRQLAAMADLVVEMLQANVRWRQHFHEQRVQGALGGPANV